jgi:hypothetical protein
MVTDQGQENFNAGLHEWLKRNNDLHHQFEILGTDWEEAYNGTCGEGTCDYSDPSTFTVYFSGELGEKKSFRVNIPNYGFAKLVKEIAELMR